MYFGVCNRLLGLGLFLEKQQMLLTSDRLITEGPSTSHDDYNAGDDPMELEVELSGSESNLLDEGSGDKLPNS